MRYRLQEKRAIRNKTGVGRGEWVESYRWQDVAICDDYDELKAFAAGCCGILRIVDTENGDEVIWQNTLS